MSGMYPESIELPGGGGPPGMGGGPPAGNGGGDPVALVKQALALMEEAKGLEPDEEDTLLIEKITTSMQQYVASQQQLGDQATGAGPGAKLVRKMTQRSQGF